MTRTLPLLNETDVQARFDQEQGISFITYGRVVNSVTTRKVYGWVDDLLTVIAPDATRGVVFDFRQVKRFMRDNLLTARRYTLESNSKRDNSGHPVAMLVGNYYQEQMVNIAIMVSPDSERKRIVRSFDEALTYIADWHGAHA